MFITNSIEIWPCKPKGYKAENFEELVNDLSTLLLIHKLDTENSYGFINSSITSHVDTLKKWKILFQKTTSMAASICHLCTHSMCQEK